MTIALEPLLDQIPDDVVGLCRRLREAGKRGWVVGGCVRDLLRGAGAKDWDVATDARPKEVMRIFRRVVPTGIKHGTVTVLLGGVGYEVTTLRGEGSYSDGRRPDSVVFLDDLEEDLARRDFTFNAIAIDPLERSLIDPFGGQADLEERVVRAVGVAEERFSEDGLRILRAARFAASLEAEVDPATLEAMGAERCRQTLAKVSVERVHDEWVKAMRAPRPSIAFSLMEQTRVIDLHCPELRALVGCDADAAGGDLWARALAAVDALEADPALRIAALWAWLARPQLDADYAAASANIAEAIASRLKFSSKDKARIVETVRHHDLSHYATDWGDPAVRRWLRDVGRDRAGDVIAVARVLGDAARVEDLAVRAEAAHDAVLTTRELAIGGGDLMKELGMKPSRRIGEVLEALLELVIDDPTKNERHVLLEAARPLVAGD